MSQPAIFAMGILTTVGLFAHIFGGGKEIAGPMLRADFDLVARRVLWVCWHAITAELLLGAAVLLYAGSVAPTATTQALVGAVAVVHLIEATLFVAVGVHSRKDMDRPFLKMPQWILFGVTGTVSAVALLT